MKMRAVHQFFLVCLIIFSVTGDAPGSGDKVLNDMLDKLLDSMRNLVKLGNMDESKIPNIARDVDVGFGITAHCKCQDGWVRSLASLKRNTNVAKKTEGNKTVLNAKVSFEKLEFGFKKCDVITAIGSMSPQINGQVDSNFIDLQISITGQGDKCVTAVDHIKVDKIGKIEITTGQGFLHTLKDKIFTWIAQNFHDEIVKKLDNELSNMVRKSIPKLDFCLKIPH